MDKSIVQVIFGTRILPVVCFLLVFLVVMATAGCGGPNVYMHPSPGLDRIKKIAVMPFDNMTKDDKAGEKVRVGFVLELLRIGSFSVIDINETDRILRGAGLSYSTGQRPPVATGTLVAEDGTADSTPISKRIGEALNVEAIFAGSVQAYTVERSGDRVSPEVSIAAKLVDAETGIIIWAGSHTKRGSMGVPLFGWGRVTSLSILSQRVIQDMVSSLAEYMPRTRGTL